MSDRLQELDKIEIPTMDILSWQFGLANYRNYKQMLRVIKTQLLILNRSLQELQAKFQYFPKISKFVKQIGCAQLSLELLIEGMHPSPPLRGPYICKQSLSGISKCVVLWTTFSEIIFFPKSFPVGKISRLASILIITTHHPPPTHSPICESRDTACN